MALYALSDFHLSIGVEEKPMDIFGTCWHGYMEKIKKNCECLLTDQDMLLIAGDISWATHTQQAIADLRFIQQLPGKKIISRGNHDYWWATNNKLNELKAAEKLSSIEFLHNNFFVFDSTAVCGNRGWTYSQTPEDQKIYARELIRLELSLSAAKKAGYHNKIVMTHYPPAFSNDWPDAAILSLFHKYHVSQCIYGHLHNTRPGEALEGVYEGIRFRLTSADYLDFCPQLILT